MNRFQQRIRRCRQQATSSNVSGRFPEPGNGEYIVIVQREQVGSFPNLRPFVKPVGWNQASPTRERFVLDKRA